MRRPASTAQLELPLAAPPQPRPPALAPSPAVACARCGWYRAPAAPCPICRASPEPGT